MLAQTNLRKGFTLIELMVVIVIIGILAAIAIPKLFGMSAKAKAQEVGPAAGTWIKLQQAYNMETGKWGGAEKISYKAPGSQKDAPHDGVTSNFKYDVDETVADDAFPTFTAESKFNAEPCQIGSKWDVAFTAASGETPEMGITGANNDAAGCLSLTPNYLKIGCANAASAGLDADDIDCGT